MSEKWTLRHGNMEVVIRLHNGKYQYLRYTDPFYGTEKWEDLPHTAEVVRENINKYSVEEE